MQITIIISTFLLVIINIWIGLRQKSQDNLETFISSKNHFSSFAITLSYLGTIIGGGMFFTVGEMGFQAGIAPFSIALSYIIGFFLLSLIIKKIRESTQKEGVDTFYDYVNSRLTENLKWSKNYQLSVSLINTLLYFFMLAGQFLILSAFYGYFFQLNGKMIMLISTIIVGISILIYSILGGIKKDIATDIYQSLWLILIMIITIVVLFNKPDVFASLHSLPDKLLNGSGYGYIFPIGVLLFFSPAFIGRYDFWQRIISSKDNKTAIRSLWMSIPFILIAYGLFIYLGMYARANAAGRNIENVAVLWSLNEIMPTVIFGLIAVGLYAAVMSTADTLLNVSTVSLWKLVKTFKKESKSENIELKEIRVFSVIVGIFSILMIFVAKSVVTLIVGAFSSLVIFSPSILYIVFSKIPKGKIATLSLVFPYLLFLIIFILLPDLRMYAFIPAFLLSVMMIGLMKLVKLK